MTKADWTMILNALCWRRRWSTGSRLTTIHATIAKVEKVLAHYERAQLKLVRPRDKRWKERAHG